MEVKSWRQALVSARTAAERTESVRAACLWAERLPLELSQFEVFRKKRGLGWRMDRPATPERGSKGNSGEKRQPSCSKLDTFAGIGADPFAPVCILRSP